MRLPFLQTSFVGQQFHFLPLCASTNAEVHAAVVKNGAIPEGLTILADHQTAGRGQRGNVWQAPPGQNLTFSVLLRPTFLAATDQFALSIAVALAGYDTLVELLGHQTGVRLKWPNDLYIDGNKAGGILIENSLRGASLSSSIVGIGLNVNQTSFDPSLPNPTSLALAAGQPLLDRAAILSRLLHHLEARYLALRGGGAARQLSEYHAALYRLGEPARFAFPTSPERPSAIGIITGVDLRGRLLISFDRQEAPFNMQEVRFVE
jgi:BirA family transcriptional regulator, biotin operon repressor / biotin---[acetyl-CoA-carboxylase] ligase